MLGVAQDPAPSAALLAQGDVLGADAVGIAVVALGDFAAKQVHFRRADKAGDEGRGGLVAEPKATPSLIG